MEYDITTLGAQRVIGEYFVSDLNNGIFILDLESIKNTVDTTLPPMAVQSGGVSKNKYFPFNGFNIFTVQQPTTLFFYWVACICICLGFQTLQNLCFLAQILETQRPHVGALPPKAGLVAAL